MNNSDLIVGLFTLLVTAVFYYFTRDLSRLSIIYVNYVLIILGSLSILVLVKALVRPERIAFFESVLERNNIIAGLLILLAYLLLLPVIGFLLASYLFFLVMTLYLSEARFTAKNILVSVIISLVVVSLFYAVFRHVLLVPLPEGMLFME